MLNTVRNLFGNVDTQMSVHAGVDWSACSQVRSNVVSVDPSAADVRRLLEGNWLEHIRVISEMT